ncbi:MAG: hypothetical protein CMJ86_01160 [Planctomycetes bacterium]|nr:hypothetical protein [Planctomycetota bacterium]
MRPAPEVHDALACLLSYPEEGREGMRYPAAIEVVVHACPETLADLQSFSQGIQDVSAGELEELYTRTFDNVAERSLEIGWQLFGENYARGVLMVRFRALMRKYGVPEHTELPDHLTHVLALLGRAPVGLAAAFASGQVLTAIKKVTEGLRSYESPWVGVLEATRKVLQMHLIDEVVASEVGQ